jgi:hypothetical protein
MVGLGLGLLPLINHLTTSKPKPNPTPTSNLKPQTSNPGVQISNSAKIGQWSLCFTSGNMAAALRFGARFLVAQI